jgi:hypothetical protein
MCAAVGVVVIDHAEPFGSSLRRLIGGKRLDPMRPQRDATFAVPEHGANTFHHLAEDFCLL